ncbi:MAG: glycosyltransferase family 4 protein [Methanoregula sp.]|uniref:glycosyltransferase family 4 protein n=1 Tax=Methanoregula sp. TaxID=2052170 RepID=UPI003C246A01
MKKIDYHTCIVTFPISRAFRMPLSNLVDVVSCISKKTSVIIGSYENIELNYREDSNVTVSQFDIGVSSDLPSRIMRFVKFQILSLFSFLKIIRGVDKVIFFMEWDPILLIMVSKIFGKKTIWILPSSATLMRKYNPDPLLAFSRYPEWLCYCLSDVIGVFSANLIKEWDLVKWKEKIVIAPNHFIDFNQFKITKAYTDRENLVGYIGRFSKEKGIGNFLKAAEIVLKTHPEIKIFLGGSGDPEKFDVDLHKFQAQDQVRVSGWIPHNILQVPLNNLKILVIPSYTEALPNILLEAMATGTLVIASKVGAIPDIIKDGETGFLLENNSPEGIADKIIQVLISNDILSITERAEKLVKNKYCFEAAVERYQQIFNEL